jgi:hypothetical protein
MCVSGCVVGVGIRVKESEKWAVARAVAHFWAVARAVAHFWAVAQ